MRLINKTLGIELEVQSGDILGRKEGRFAEVLRGFEQISRRHCRFVFDPSSGWTVTDLGSTNGTKYNGKLLQPGQACPLRDDSFLLVGNIEFYVQIEDVANEKTKRM
ncbi:FHA domain-containing protein [Thermoflexus sp.]|uniref:FHA domain-containing protein n=1 Tax=Thermoflexus sp. TaxID=1969742 RepID=UPI0035E4138F